MAKISQIIRLGGYEVEETSNYSSKSSRFEAINKERLDADSLKHVVECTLVKVHNKLSDKDELKVLIVSKYGKKLYRLWRKLDNTSYRRYKDAVGAIIDPAKVVFYMLHDPEEEYGKAENNFSWEVCRILKDAVTGYNNSDAAFLSDDEAPF